MAIPFLILPEKTKAIIRMQYIPIFLDDFENWFLVNNLHENFEKHDK